MVTQRQPRDADTATRILDVAQRLVQTRGFNGFSYADIAGELKISTASLHYHFSGKATLGVALIARYADRFARALKSLDTSLTEAPDKIIGYENLYLEVLRDERMCLCGILAAENETLDASMRNAINEYFDFNERWLAGVLEQGRRDGTLGFDGLARDEARLVLSGLQGAMLVARSYGDIARFEAVASKLVEELTRDSRSMVLPE